MSSSQLLDTVLLADPSVMDVKMNAAEALKFVVPNKMLKATGRDRITLVACSAFPLEQSIPAL